MLSKVHRQLIESVMVDDIIDRLIQGHVIKVGDKQDVMTPSKNQERMQILLSKVSALILRVKLP